MAPQRYEAVNTHDDDNNNNNSPLSPDAHYGIPSSPPPSFRSRASSPTSRRLLNQDPLSTEAHRDLEDTFDDGEASDEENDGDDRQRLMRAEPPTARQDAASPRIPAVEAPPVPTIERRVTELPAFRPMPTSTRATDGVFANLSAKPERGEQLDDKPPTYEQAAADATPPYWETTILAPGMSSDEVYVDGLPVGSVFSFVWNGMISMSFQLVGFLLTYLLHTTHAAKHGSRAGLGLTLVQYGFYMTGSSDGGQDTGNPGQFSNASPPDPNSHDFDPNTVDGAGNPASGGHGMGGFTSADWISYVLMIVGWFILIRAVSDFLRARRHEQLVLQSPSRGLPVPVVAEGETPEQAA
ncbi:hypothetical protein LTR99_009468 [Exophiala xenobiotica]|uniref:Metal homeostatis protein bsd2 n=1 Tax=Vermiconidia calcicola TaxID=1690605 RepID=A0AAV9PWC3_9PEZI|nr:hypothetical protein LTR92_002296 [Exophiala xenobiotica]KAK5530857.1 hypothetical protein LTR25_008714 [Vermiconidia calcicola]KAK5544349.1 hypothetical protein LTR23_004437 [Chaetothyriales sp. CCFEE 6169]KAK5210387.1 hypothetical protein LTR41_004055 [Exophiala xenobiotica]KAK5268974.1 hypothetical protein LTR96_005758 [Exophiala xenobiotica]